MLQISSIMQQITYSTLQQWQQTGKIFTLIDVREIEEHQQYNIGGSLIPLNDFIKVPPPLPTDQPIVVYCKKGIRSQLAIQRLSYKIPSADFYNLQNGIWHLINS